MIDYKMLYYKLYSTVSDEIENLQKIQCELEEILIESEDKWKNKKNNAN